MPTIRAGMRKPPPGFDTVADKLDEYEAEMKLAVQDDSKGVVGQTTRARKAQKRARAEDEADGAQDSGDNHGEGKPRDDDEGGEGEESAQQQQQQPGEPEGELALSEGPIPPLWRVAQINHARTRYVFNACFREHRISKEVYDYCCEMNFIDGGLARRWRLPGYEHLCCTACGVPGAASVAANLTSKFALRDKQERKVRAGALSSSSGSSERATCICRVPAAQRKNKSFLACAVCGCEGCCSADASATTRPA